MLHIIRGNPLFAEGNYAQEFVEGPLTFLKAGVGWLSVDGYTLVTTTTEGSEMLFSVTLNGYLDDSLSFLGGVPIVSWETTDGAKSRSLLAPIATWNKAHKGSRLTWETTVPSPEDCRSMKIYWGPQLVDRSPVTEKFAFFRPSALEINIKSGSYSWINPTWR